MTTVKPREFTGRKMLMIMLAFFGVIISVNVFMAYSAVKTFPGLETDNAYIASQQFNERAAAQRALGWSIEFTHEGDEVVLKLHDSEGVAVIPAAISATLGRPTFSGNDITLEFRLVGNEYRAEADLASGPWRLFLDAVAQDGTLYKKRMHLVVSE